MTHPQVPPDPAFGLLKLYHDALPHVHGYQTTTTMQNECGYACTSN